MPSKANPIMAATRLPWWRSRGYQAPGCPTGVNFLAFTELALNNVNGGGTIFLATLSGTGVTAANNKAIFCVDNNGTLQLVVRTGDVIGGKDDHGARLPPGGDDDQRAGGRAGAQLLGLDGRHRLQRHVQRQIDRDL